jgi:hypothetical protein
VVAPARTLDYTPCARRDGTGGGPPGKAAMRLYDFGIIIILAAVAAAVAIAVAAQLA